MVGRVKICPEGAEIPAVIGSLVGGYRVVTELGAGPSGSVYYAEHPVIGRRAAIKVLSPELSAARDRLDRYITHLKVVSSIRHPNIVDVLDIGQMPGSAIAVGGSPAQIDPPGELTFIVMEMLEGESLGERLERVGALDESVAIRILVQIASAVGAAHERGLVHAALKSENVFITNSDDYPDFVKVLDFAAYKLQPPGSAVRSPYLAPEVTADADPDSAADVYAAGILAYEMLAGALPWVREHEEHVRSEERMPPLPPYDRRAGVSKALSTIVMRAISQDPDQRWPSLRDFRRAIERAASSVTTSAVATSASGAAPTSVPERAGPATPEEIQRTERVQAKKVGRTLSNIILRRINENRLQLPSMPLVALKCLDVLRDPNATFADVARVIEQDPVIATRILRVVNSAAYSRRHAVKTLEQAVSQIGVKPMRILLVEVAACQVFTSRSPGIRQKFKLIWEHCLAVGMLARDLAERLKSRVEPDTAYLGGLLHDIGKPIIGGLLLEAERKLIEELDVPWMTETLWQKTVAESHRSVGAAVAATWKLPPDVIEAIEQCDSYDRDAGQHSCGNLVRFANTLAKREGIYVGDVSGDEIIAAILQGRAVLNVDEVTEATLIATLRDRTNAVTGGRTHRAADGAADRGRRSRPV